MSRILIFLDHKGNRRLLAETLAKRHEVITPDTDDVIDDDFDLCILGGVALDRIWERIQARKLAVTSQFLPCLLVTSRQDVGMATRFLWKVVDELIISPIEKNELQARVEVLLLARRLSLEFSRTIIRSAPVGICVLDRNAKVQAWNPACERIFGWAEREVLECPYPAVPEEREDEFRRSLDKVLRGETISHEESRRRKKDGSMIDVTFSAAPLSDAIGGITHIMSMAADITDRKRAEEDLRLSHARLAELSRRLVETHETEHRAIGRELHDQIGQMLTAMKLTLELAGQLPAEAAARKLQQAQELVVDLMGRVSRLSLELRPPMLDDFGLVSALIWHVNRYQDQTLIDVVFTHSCAHDNRFNAEIETTAYRSVQEALTNVARHAGARRVSLDVRTSGEWMEVVIEDDGVGFDPESALSQNRGLSGMRERVHLVGGTFHIDSEKGRGTKTLIRLPLVEDFRSDAMLRRSGA